MEEEQVGLKVEVIGSCFFAGEGGPERPVNVPEGEGRPEESNRGDAEEIQPVKGSSFLSNIWLKTSIPG